MTIDLTCVNDAPVANDDTVTVDEDSSNTDVTPRPARQRHGRRRRHPDDHQRRQRHRRRRSTLTGGNVTFTPDADACGDGYGGFDYTVDDGNGGTDTAHATVDVTCVNDNPVATDDTASGTEDTDVVIRRDRPRRQRQRRRRSTRLSVSAVSNPTGGTVDLTAGVVTFTPDREPVRRRRRRLRLHGRRRQRRHRHRPRHDRPRPASTTPRSRATTRSPGPRTRTSSSPTRRPPGQRHATPRTTRSASPRVSNPTGGTVDLTDGVVTFTPDRQPVRRRRGRLRLHVNDGHGGTDTGHVTIDITCVDDAPGGGRRLGLRAPRTPPSRSPTSTSWPTTPTPRATP